MSVEEVRQGVNQDPKSAALMVRRTSVWSKVRTMMTLSHFPSADYHCYHACHGWHDDDDDGGDDADADYDDGYDFEEDSLMIHGCHCYCFHC